MTTSTLFALASLSKPMTTTMMASLADDGLLNWDQPVHEIIPCFTLSDPEWAQQVRLRHLVGLSSGVPENNTLLFLERFTPTQMIASLPEIASVAPPGELYGYSNHVARFALSQFDGPARIISEEGLAELHDGAVEMEPGAPYALGWEVWDDYLGLKTLRHTGNSLGFTTSLRIAQNKGLGVVVLANEGFVDLFVAAVDRFVMELLLGRPHADDVRPDHQGRCECRTVARPGPAMVITP